MQPSNANLFTRPDTLFGVCEALGEDFGFNPLLLRATLGVLLLWNPVVILSAYLGAGILVFVSRWLAPNPRPAAALAGGQSVAAPLKGNDNSVAETFAAAA